MTVATSTEVAAALNSIRAVADAIKELGEVPSGSLYANLMSVLTFSEYEKIIGILTRSGLVAKRDNLLVWKQP